MDHFEEKLDIILDLLRKRNPDRSEKIDELVTALAKAQGGYKKLVPNRKGSRGMYADLEAIFDAVRGALSANGLACVQYTDLLDEGTGAALLKTMVAHASGQYISSTARTVLSKTDRTTGRSHEFHKRQHASSLLGIAPSPYDPQLFDDDGEEQLEEEMTEQAKNPAKKKIIEHEVVISDEQYRDLMYELQGYDDLTKGLLETYGIETLADLPKSEYFPALAKLRKIKNTIEGYRKK